MKVLTTLVVVCFASGLAFAGVGLHCIAVIQTVASVGTAPLSQAASPQIDRSTVAVDQHVGETGAPRPPPA